MMGQVSADPAICGCCGRLASGVGVQVPELQEHLWICALCGWKAGMTTVNLHPTKLKKIEVDAMMTALRATIGDVLPAILEVMWARGVRDLSLIDERTLASLMQLSVETPAYQAALLKTLVHYANAARVLLANERDNEVPF